MKANSTESQPNKSKDDVTGILRWSCFGLHSMDFWVLLDRGPDVNEEEGHDKEVDHFQVVSHQNQKEVASNDVLEENHDQMNLQKEEKDLLEHGCFDSKFPHPADANHEKHRSENCYQGNRCRSSQSPKATKAPFHWNQTNSKPKPSKLLSALGVCYHFEGALTWCNGTPK